MGFLKGNVTFSQFQITNGNIDQAEYLQRLKAAAFRAPAVGGDKTVGWTSIDNILDVGFEGGLSNNDRYRMFALRIDRRVLPAAVIKIRCLEAEKEMLVRTGQKKLYREQRDAIRESIRIELSKTIPASPRVYDVAWEAGSGMVFVGTVSPVVLDDFVSLFRYTFRLILSPARSMIITDAGRRVGIDPITIGREFLTWLWFKSEEHSGVVSRCDVPFAEVHFLRRVDLASGEGEYAESVCCQGQHADLKEAKEALRQGKKIIEARIRLAHGEFEYEFTMRDNGFQFKTMRIPQAPIEGDEDKAGLALERVFLMEDAASSVGVFISEFMALRLSEKWEGELSGMAGWLNREGVAS